MLKQYFIRIAGRFFFLSTVGALAGFGLVGCATTTPVSPVGQMILQAEPDRLWQVSQDELEKRGFRLDRIDRRSGIIQTLPLTGAQWFEFWRSDLADDESLAESSLHTVRRSVSLTLSPAPDHQYGLSCEVKVERLSSVKAVATASVRARSIFAGAAGRMPALSTHGRKDVWITLGSDTALENNILLSIKKQIHP